MLGAKSLASEYVPKLPAITLAFATGSKITVTPMIGLERQHQRDLHPR